MAVELLAILALTMLRLDRLPKVPPDSSVGVSLASGVDNRGPTCVLPKFSSASEAGSSILWELSNLLDGLDISLDASWAPSGPAFLG